MIIIESVGKRELGPKVLVPVISPQSTTAMIGNTRAFMSITSADTRRYAGSAAIPACHSNRCLLLKAQAASTALLGGSS